MLSFDLNPVIFAANVGAKTGFSIANSLLSNKPVGPSLAEVLSKPTSPIIVNNPPGQKSFLDNLGIGFIEKNVIIIGAFALGAVAIYGSLKK